jgi:predicted nuclease of predicted toxin-antitoxin system
MRLLTDQDVYAVTVQFLRGLGHDVATAAERGMSQAADADLLRAAEAEGRVFVTRDRDYGGLVFVQALGAGVLYLRALPSALQAVHSELGRVLALYDEEELRGRDRGCRARPPPYAKGGGWRPGAGRLTPRHVPRWRPRHPGTDQGSSPFGVREGGTMDEAYNPIIRTFCQFRAGLRNSLGVARHEIRPGRPSNCSYPSKGGGKSGGNSDDRDSGCPPSSCRGETVGATSCGC